MSSRAFRRLQNDSNVIKLNVKPEEGDDSEEEDDGEAINPPVAFMQPQKRKQKTMNPFEMLIEDDAMMENEEEEAEEKEKDIPSSIPTIVSGSSKQTRKKKKKKKGKGTAKEQETSSQKLEEGTDEIDAALKEVTELLGGLETTGPERIDVGTHKTLISRPILCVDRRYLSADNEMKRIFGARVVRSELNQRRDHRRRFQRQSMLAVPKDTWPTIEKLGLSMQLAEVKNNCQYFTFEHSLEYQKVQFSFLDAVETYDPNAIAAVLHAHPYHIDSLLQLSEVCKMGEDMQMAADLIERALYQFECCFHPLFNFTQDNCRLGYSRAENRSFFLALFRHLNYVERKGCHRTALELCKLILSLDPETDPLCIVLMIDYHAIRSYEYQYLLDLSNQWESKRNLSQLPNFSFSIPLAMFHCATREDEKSENGDQQLQLASEKIQEALIMFPSLLLPLLEKCGVTFHPSVMNHILFSCNPQWKEPDALQLLIKLYIERTHSLWKEPEVLHWLEDNSKQVIIRADNKDSLIEECAKKRQLRYVGTPRNISRHVILSDLENTTSALPRDVTGTPIMMYDPLPPEDSTAGYTRPPRSQRPEEDISSNPFSLFLQSLLPSFTVPGTGTPNTGPLIAGMPQHAPRPRQNNRPQGAPLPGLEGAVGGEREGFALEQAVGELTTSLRGLLHQIRTVLENVNDGDEERGGENEERGDVERDER